MAIMALLFRLLTVVFAEESRHNFDDPRRLVHVPNAEGAVDRFAIEANGQPANIEPVRSRSGVLAQGSVVGANRAGSSP